MTRIFAFIALSVSAYISLMHLALLLRVILGVFTEGTGLFSSFIYTSTEPILIPIRKRLDKSSFFAELPVDFSVIIAMFILMLLSFFLPAVVG
ncbi:MAG: YggT family protein [Clostridia bacterium]|nr:YggT family protein [Clostridia bacterium]